MSQCQVGISESAYSDHCSDSDFHHANHTPFPWTTECYHLPLPLWNPITSTAFSFPSSVVAVLMVFSGLQRKVIRGLFKIAGTPLTNLFLTVMMKDMSSGPS